MIERDAVVAEAMTWERTPWHHRARVKGAGVDCAQFPAAVYEAVGLIPHIDPEYQMQWALHHREELFIEWVLKCGAVEIQRHQVDRGDLGLWKYGRTFSHGGIFVSKEQIIHAVTNGGVSLDEIDRREDLRTYERRFFTMWPA